MTIRIELVDIGEHFDEALELFKLNWAETGFDFELNPSLPAYIRLQDSGFWFALGAFDGDTVVGYSSAVVVPHMFNPSVVLCNSDALFVHPDYRAKSVGARLIKATEAEAAKRGAVRMMWHTRAGTPLAQALRKRGYEGWDEIVARRM